MVKIASVFTGATAMDDKFLGSLSIAGHRPVYKISEKINKNPLM